MGLRVPMRMPEAHHPKDDIAAEKDLRSRMLKRTEREVASQGHHVTVIAWEKNMKTVIISAMAAALVQIETKSDGPMATATSRIPRR